MNNNQAEIAKAQLFAIMKMLSAVFDNSGGTIIIRKDVFDNAEIGFHVRQEDDGVSYIFTKGSGKTEIYHDFVKKGNMNGN